MSGSADNLRLEIGHVLFIDIVGYSKLQIAEQKERLNQLSGIVLAPAQVREASEPSGESASSLDEIISRLHGVASDLQAVREGRRQ
jgi:hypothetical protein